MRAAVRVNETPNSMKEVSPGWTPRDVAGFYGLPLDRGGAGQAVGIVSLDGPVDRAELTSDFAAMGVPMPEIREVSAGGKISEEQERGGAGETHIDLEIIGSLCPAATITVYRGSVDAAQGLADAVWAAVEGGSSVISISWCIDETDDDQVRRIEAALLRARKAGITVCAACGDSGSSDTRHPDTGLPAPAPDGRAHVCYPASSPHVLACGGTELIEEGAVRREIVWNNARSGGGATGGGVSTRFAIPPWQTRAGVDVPCVDTGYRGRVVPDVAGLAAGKDWSIYLDRKRRTAGGTSAVAPLWASIVTLANESRASRGKPTLGFINEGLYELALGGDICNDIHHGDNCSCEGYPGYVARVGYDACTGWGTPRAPSILDALIGLD